MHRYLLLFFFISLTLTSKAQNHSLLKATVLDSSNKQPIGFATVAMLKVKDSSLVSYTITDKTGGFTLHNITEKEPMRLLISCVGYESVHLSITLKKEQAIIDLGKICMDPKTLNEVTIRGERPPIIMKKDTLEFNAEAFKVRPNAVVEDLLKKLPGIQVDHNGHITVNGKNISKIKVDGKDFFADDPKIATRNLDADMITKVQVYDDREDDPDHLKPDYLVKKIINLKFKKALKKSIFGKAEAGGGTEGRYQANAFLNRFQDELQLSANLNSDNLSGTGGTASQLASPPQGSIQKATMGTFNFNDKFGKKLKLNISYSYRRGINDSKGTENKQQFVGDTTFNTFSNNMSHQTMSSQNILAQLEYGSDTSTSIKYNPKLSYSENNNANGSNSTSSNSFVPLLSQSISNGQGGGNSVSFSHDFIYYTRLNKKGESFSITNKLVINPSHNLNYTSNELISYTEALQSDTLNRSEKSINNNDQVGLTVAYHYPFSKKFAATVALFNNFDRNEGNLFTYQQNPETGLYTIFLQDQSSTLLRKQWTEAVHPELEYKFNDWMYFKAGVIVQLQQIANHFNNYTSDLNQHFGNFLPAAQLHIKNIDLSYGQDLRQPSINDLQPITIVYSPLYSFTGNPDLKPMHTHNFGFNYIIATTESFCELHSEVNIESNSFVRERTISAGGAETATVINRNGSFTFSLSGDLQKNFKKHNDWQIHERTVLEAGMEHNFFEVNNQDGYQNTTALRLTQEINANWKDILEFRPSYSISPEITRYERVDYKNSIYVTHQANLGIDLHLPNKLIGGADYSYTYNPKVAEGLRKSSNLLILGLGRCIQNKDRGTIRIICYDLLNQAINTYHYATENTINDIQNKTVRRYFMLAYSYRFNNTVTK